jgi:hypothetical protein
MYSYIKDHWLKILFISLIFTIFMGRFQYKMPKRDFADFHTYYYTGQKMLKGENVYDDNAYKKDKIANFKYPPIFAAITALFALTSQRMAATMWFSFNFLLIILFIYYCGKLIFGQGITPRQKNGVYFWSLFLTLRFYMQNFDEGQVNFLMMTTLLLGLYAASRKKEFLGGVFFGFSILVKYMTALFIPYFLFKKRFKIVIYTLLSLVIFSLLPALFFGWERNLSLQKNFFPYLCKTSLGMHSLSDYANQSIMATVVRFFSGHGSYGTNLLHLNDHNLVFIAGVTYILMFLLSIYPVNTNSLFKTNNNLSKIDIGMLFICVALFNPNAWIHNFIFLTFGYMVVFFYLYKVKPIDKIVMALVVLSFILHSLTASFFTRSWAQNLFETLSFVTFGAISLFIALLKIKFSPCPIK